MSLLDCLAGVVPWHHRTTQNDALGQLVIRHMSEIEEARKQGYSWLQIEQVARSIWIESGEWNEKWSLSCIEARYNKIRKDAM